MFLHYVAISLNGGNVTSVLFILFVFPANLAQNIRYSHHFGYLGHVVVPRGRMLDILSQSYCVSLGAPGSVQSDTANICWSLLGSDVCWLSFNLCWLQIMILAKSNSTKQSKIIKCTNDGLEAACIRSHMNVCRLG